MLRDCERLEVPLELMTTGQPQGDNPLRRRRVLVVGDEADVAELIRYNLIREGWDVFTTGSGADALELVRDIRPDVVLLDIRVLRRNGWEVCRRLKEDPATRAISVIMVVGRGEEGDEMRGFEAGADAVVILP